MIQNISKICVTIYKLTKMPFKFYTLYSME